MVDNQKYGTIHCLFEQSGTFKNVFKEKGYVAYDYDISNAFEQTDYVIDLFNEIEQAYEGKSSIFDNITKNDLIIAFFPCTYFSKQNGLIWRRQVYNFKTWSEEKIQKYIDDRKQKREEFYILFVKFISIIKKRKLKTIIENPYHENYLLTKKEFKNPSLIIMDRAKLGDYYKKPTMFYFYNLEPTFFSEYVIKNNNKKDGWVNDYKGIERSLMHKDFATNFINKYILGV